MDAAWASIGCEIHLGREEVEFLTLSSALNDVFRGSKRVWAWWWDGGRNLRFLLGFLAENVPEFEQTRKNPEKTCGNQRNLIDKPRRKDEGEMRYRSPDPHEH
jgi:hypothetical protein